MTPRPAAALIGLLFLAGACGPGDLYVTVEPTPSAPVTPGPSTSAEETRDADPGATRPAPGSAPTIHEPAAAMTYATRTTASTVTPTDPPPTTLPVWTGRRPNYDGRGACDQANANRIARAMWDRGADDDDVEWMLERASAETGCDHTKFVDDHDDTSFSYCQVNARAGWFDPGEALDHIDPWRTLEDADYAAGMCADLWAVCGVGPWRAGDYGCEAP